MENGLTFCIDADTAGFSDDQSAGSDVPHVDSEFEVAIASTRRYGGHVQSGRAHRSKSVDGIDAKIHTMTTEPESGLQSN